MIAVSPSSQRSGPPVLEEVPNHNANVVVFLTDGRRMNPRHLLIDHFLLPSTIPWLRNLRHILLNRSVDCIALFCLTLPEISIVS